MVPDQAGRAAIFLNVGRYGSGTINITNGGSVSARGVAISCNSYSTITSGIIIVDGLGSKLISTTGNNLYLGNGDYGRLEVTNGGTVDVADSVLIRPNGFLTLDVDDNTVLTAGGNFTNDGMVLLEASMGLETGVYTPIAVTGTWAGTGVYKTIGGEWNSLAHTFTVAEALNTTAGTETSVDLAAYQRLNVGSTLTVSFQSGPEVLSFTAEETSSTTLAGLLSSLDEDVSVLSSWDFTITGIAAGNQTMLSYAVTGDPADVQVWHYDSESGWSEHTVGQVTVENGHATFLVDSFSSYAVTGIGGNPVPEPSTLALLIGMGVSGLAMLRRRSLFS